MRASMKLLSKQSLLFCSCLLMFGLSPAHAGSMLIDNVKVVNGNKETSYEKVDVLMDGGKIISVMEEIEVSDGVTVIDGKGKTLTAGLFNSDTQMGILEISAVSETRDDGSEDDRFTASFNPIEAFNPSSVVIPYNRMHGLTHTLVIPSNDVSMIAGKASIVNLSQSSKSVEVKSAGVVVALGEKGSALKGGSRAVALASLTEVLEDARDYAANKDAYNRGARREHAVSRADLEALIPVVQRRTPLIVYVERASDIERVLAFAKKQNVSLILVGVSEAWMLAEQIAKAQVPVIIDPIRNLATSYEALGSRLDNAKILNDAGVRLLFSGMGAKETHNAYLVRQSAGNAVANGLPYHVAIAALTSNPSAVFGLSGYGEIKAGSKATAVLWDGDPLEMSASVEMVLINGQSFALESRATRLRDRYFEHLKSVTDTE